MKNLGLFLSTVLLSSQVFAVATLRLPVFVEGDAGPVSAAQVNQELAVVGTPVLPLYIEVSNNENAYEKVRAFEVQVERALGTLGDKYNGAMLVKSLYPTHNDTAKYATCYQGNAAEVVDFVQSLSDTYFSDQMSLYGYKFKDNTVLLVSDDETPEFLNDMSDLWKNWNSVNDDLLILSAISDSGDDVQESLVPRCK